jgi:hypothetical protein
MAQAARLAITHLRQLLVGDDTLAAECAAIAQKNGLDVPALWADTVLDFHIAPELAEKGTPVKYPVVYVYCDRVHNKLHEKFRTFSGTADLNIEIRVSHDHADELQAMLQLYVEAVTNVIDGRRGTWSREIFHAGDYEIAFGPVKRGGRNFLQTARVKLQVFISAA